MKQTQHRKACGFTLLEVVLAIGLSATLLTLLTLAINLYLLRVDAGRETIRNAQLARGVLQLIAEDLQNAATAYEQDVTTVAALAAAAKSFDVDSADLPPDDTNDTDNNSQDQRSPLGVSGDAEQIQVDVLRVRRPQQFQPAEFATDFEPPPTLTGISTVRYWCAADGLVRQEVNRDVFLWEEKQGLNTSEDASQSVLAAEVVRLQFRYSDGDQFVDAWDLEEREGVPPTAVEVQISLRIEDTRASTNLADGASTQTYRMMVAIPQSAPQEESETEGEESAQPSI